MEQFAIGADFKSAAARRNQRKRLDAFAEFENLGRQTDGLRRVVSNDAIFDRDFGLHPAGLLSGENGTEVVRGGQGASLETLGRGWSAKEDFGRAPETKSGRGFKCRDRPSNPFQICSE
jgi:hypothetical protein